MWRSRIKHVVEAALTHSGLLPLARRRRRADALILAYHNIVPDDAAPFGDPGLHVTRRALAEQLDVLAAACEVVPLELALAPAAHARTRPRAAITFDDAYAGALTAGADECAARGLPFTVFVAPGRLGGQSFWWDAWAPRAGDAWADGDREDALERCAGREQAVRDLALGRGYTARATPPHALTCTADALVAVASRPGVSVAPHSWSHPNLARLDPHELRVELERPLAWLREHCPRTLPLLAYPYGRSTPAVAVGAAAAGYEGGLLIAGGWWRGGDAFGVPRVNVPAGLSTDGFALRTADLLCR